MLIRSCQFRTRRAARVCAPTHNGRESALEEAKARKVRGQPCMHAENTASMQFSPPACNLAVPWVLCSNLANAFASNPQRRHQCTASKGAAPNSHGGSSKLRPRQSAGDRHALHRPSLLGCGLPSRMAACTRVTQKHRAACSARLAGRARAPSVDTPKSRRSSFTRHVPVQCSTV